MVFPLRLAVAVSVSVATVVPVVALQRFSKNDSDRFQTKLTRITEFGNKARDRAGAKRSTPSTQSTPVSDTEVNAYLEYAAKTEIPPGIVEPTLTALGDGRIGGRVGVDLDVVRKQKQRGWLDPLSYMSGTLPLTATGLLITKDGVGRFQLESAALSGVTVPKVVIQELLGYYSRTPANPGGISMDDPFELPAGIREIQVARGQAIVVQ